jgi:hypothetical protein
MRLPLCSITSIALLNAAPPLCASDAIRLTGREAEAVQVAVTAFRDKTQHFYFGDLRHFSVECHRHGKQIEILFDPDLPRHPLPSDPEMGGRTRYGYVVRYWLSLDTLKIVKLEFAR